MIEQLPSWVPKPYMKKGVRFMLSRGAAGLLLDPGLGKTSITLASFKVLKQQKLVRGMLVIAPLRVIYEVWPEEIDKWVDFQQLRYTILHGSRKEDALNTDADIYLINPDGMEWLVDALPRKAIHWPFNMLVNDESTLYKHTQTRRFKTLKGLLPKFDRRYILTGTPAPNGLEDLFGQAYVLDLGHSLGAYITQYRRKYFDKTGFGGYSYVVKDGAEPQIYKALAPLVLRMDAADYLKLPPLVPANHYVELPKAARKAYDKLESEFILKVTGGTVTASNAAVLGGKLRQFCNGGIYLDATPDEDKRRVKEIHTAKVEVLTDLLNELSGQPTLVAYEFKHDAVRMVKALAKAGFKNVPVVGGSMKPKELSAVKADWNAGKLPVVIANPQSVAHGLNLQKTGRAIIWCSLTWNLEHYDQFIRRIWRQGVKERVFVHHILVRNSVEAGVLRGLAGKDRTQRALLAALRAYSLKSRRKTP